LSERLLKDVSLLYRKLDVDFEARWFSILYTLNQKSPMAVTKKYQGRGIGAKLMQAIINRARELNAEAIYLQTSTRLKAANYLYQKFGYKKTQKNPFKPSRYARVTFVMKLDLKKMDDQILKNNPIKITKNI